MKRGFTLIELLLSIVIISMLTGLSMPAYRILLTKNDLDIASNIIASSFRRAQILTQGVDGDSSWGVKAQSGSVVIFKGASYTARDVTFDEMIEISSTIGISGITEIVFAKLTGLPQTTGTTTLSTENDTNTITINAKGMVDY